MASRSVDDVAAKLYAVEPPAFVAARSEAVREAREAGNVELATAIGKLRRPVLAAWAVNLLARNDSAGLEQLVALGGELREAHQQMRGEALQRLSRQRHDMLAVLAGRAGQLAADAGHPLGAEAAQQVMQTLGAALADPDAGREVQRGWLVTPLSYTGFGPPSEEMPVTAQRSRPARRDVPHEDELAHRRRERERLEHELAGVRREMVTLARDAQHAVEALERADDAVSSAQRQLAEATERHNLVAQRAQTADRARRDAERRVQHLTEQLDELN
ncbi:MAG TPA: hypothetical protein VE645_12580 [Pseudonocardiaceae bacterium]|jgi:hypothetical protein|nr:hypothetical protein [Pseudonocardiaceae bacterium]